MLFAARSVSERAERCGARGVGRAARQPFARETPDCFHVAASDAHERVEVAPLGLLVLHAPEVEAEGREVARVFFVRLVVCVVRLTVEPADGPVIPSQTPPAPAAR